MNKKNDLEINIISCLLLKPELMKEIILQDKHFIKHQRLWQFMKAFYKKFETFDIQLMYSVCKDKWHIVNYLELLLDAEPVYKNFKIYQEQLIEEINQSKKEKWVKNKIYELATNLYIGNLNVEEFPEKVKETYKNANEIFKEVETNEN